MNTFEKIYEVVKQIPRGYVATYGQVAELAGNRHWSRVVGYALHSNPQPGVIPCHRVVTKDGDVSRHLRSEDKAARLSSLRMKEWDLLTGMLIWKNINGQSVYSKPLN